jgi:ubiquinone/menaquinone biosynthesis C-methylase UbiE
MDQSGRAGLGEKQRFFDRHAESWDREHSAGEEQRKVEALVHDMGLIRGWNLLEPGCGSGQVSAALSRELGPDGRVTAFDISAGMLRQARAKALQRSVFLRAEASRLPFAPAGFDAVVLFRVFPHLNDKPACLAEFHRVLRPSGLLALAHPAGRERLNSYHAALSGEVSLDMIPDEPELRTVLNDAGFRVLSVEDIEDRFLVLARGKA